MKIQINATIVESIYICVKTTMLISCLFFMLCFLAKYWEKKQELKKHSSTFETTSWIFQTGISPWNSGSSPHIKIRQSMLDSASHDKRFLPTCRCLVKRISRYSFVCVEWESYSAKGCYSYLISASVLVRLCPSRIKSKPV